jgi:hypothetical protein
MRNLAGTSPPAEVNTCVRTHVRGLGLTHRDSRQVDARRSGRPAEDCVPCKPLTRWKVVTTSRTRSHTNLGIVTSYDERNSGIEDGRELDQSRNCDLERQAALVRA